MAGGDGERYRGWIVSGLGLAEPARRRTPERRTRTARRGGGFGDIGVERESGVLWGGGIACLRFDDGGELQK